MGVYPIDSFIIFDSGYKVLNNVHPFKDYWSLTGPLLDYMQSVFFLFFDIMFWLINLGFMFWVELHEFTKIKIIRNKKKSYFIFKLVIKTYFILY